jgi:hypothetical protein
MAKNNGKANKILAANEVTQHAPKGPNCFSFGWRSRWSICVVLNMFSSSCQCVPQHGPNRSSLYPILFVLNSILITFITNPKEDIKTYLLSKALFYFCDKPIKNAHNKRKQLNFLRSPQLINMRHNIFLKASSRRIKWIIGCSF